MFSHVLFSFFFSSPLPLLPFLPLSFSLPPHMNMCLNLLHAYKKKKQRHMNVACRRYQKLKNKRKISNFWRLCLYRHWSCKGFTLVGFWHPVFIFLSLASWFIVWGVLSFGHSHSVILALLVVPTLGGSFQVPFSLKVNCFSCLIAVSVKND